ncbi:MAG: DUF2294 domain-containing protein, partial [Bacillota bacterium]
KFEKEYMGRGPKDIKTKIIQNHILIIVDGFLTPSEKKLADNKQGIELIKDMRSVLFENSRGNLIELIKQIINIDIISTHFDISTKTGEKVIVLTVNCDLEARLKS